MANIDGVTAFIACFLHNKGHEVNKISIIFSLSIFGAHCSGHAFFTGLSSRLKVNKKILIDYL